MPGYAAPFQHQGSGTINALVLAMLGLIAQRRNGRVIFAMEEPELSLPPHVQKAMVDKVRELAAQALFSIAFALRHRAIHARADDGPDAR